MLQNNIILYRDTIFKSHSDGRFDIDFITDGVRIAAVVNSNANYLFYNWYGLIDVLLQLDATREFIEFVGCTYETKYIGSSDDAIVAIKYNSFISKCSNALKMEPYISKCVTFNDTIKYFKDVEGENITMADLARLAQQTIISVFNFVHENPFNVASIRLFGEEVDYNKLYGVGRFGVTENKENNL